MRKERRERRERERLFLIGGVGIRKIFMMKISPELDFEGKLGFPQTNMRSILQIWEIT